MTNKYLLLKTKKIEQMILNLWAERKLIRTHQGLDHFEINNNFLWHYLLHFDNSGLNLMRRNEFRVLKMGNSRYRCTRCMGHSKAVSCNWTSEYEHLTPSHATSWIPTNEFKNIFVIFFVYALLSRIILLKQL